jgi:thioredoxin-related protein
MKILVFTSSNCSHCPKAERVVREVAPIYSNYDVSHEKIRTKTPYGKELSIGYNVMGTPTILFLDENNNELKRIVGAPSEENLKKEIEKLLGLRKSFFSKLFKNN